MNFNELVRRVLREKYPHTLNPPAFLAQVTAISRIGEKTWEYSIRILEADRSDKDYPEIPGIKSHVEVEAGVGGTVAVAMLYGQIWPVIIDEVIP